MPLAERKEIGGKSRPPLPKGDSRQMETALEGPRVNRKGVGKGFSGT